MFAGNIVKSFIAPHPTTYLNSMSFFLPTLPPPRFRCSHTPSPSPSQVRVPEIYEYLHALKALHPSYADIVIDSSPATVARLSTLTMDLLEGAEHCNDPLVLEVKRNERIQADDVAGVRGVEEKVEEEAGVRFDDERIFTTRNVLEEESKSLVHRGLFDLMEKRNTRRKGSQPEQPAYIKVTRAALPVNEFNNNKSPYINSFPDVFPDGEGLLKDGSISQKHVQFLMQQYNCGVAHDTRLVFLLFDQRRRHTAVRQVALRVKMHPTSFVALEEFVTSDINRVLVAKAVKGDKEAGRTVSSLVMPFIRATSNKVPYAPGERDESQKLMYAIGVALSAPSFSSRGHQTTPTCPPSTAWLLRRSTIFLSQPPTCSPS